MADTWLVPPTIVNGKPIPGHWLKAVYNDMQQLANPTRILQQGQLAPHSGSYTTTSASFVTIAALSMDFEATGRDFIWIADLMFWCTASDTQGAVDLSVNGVSVSGGSGIEVIDWHAQPYFQVISYPFFDKPAGLYTIDLQHKRIAGTGTMNTSYTTNRNWLYVVEL